MAGDDFRQRVGAVRQDHGGDLLPRVRGDVVQSPLTELEGLAAPAVDDAFGVRGRAAAAARALTGRPAAVCGRT
ncbi:hypothetical protein AMK11_35750 [Streptomyces sp. CB02414]|nr:hypothetical protein AMK11_35750 [Streptomyces sp. CB02414]